MGQEALKSPLAIEDGEGRSQAINKKHFQKWYVVDALLMIVKYISIQKGEWPHLKTEDSQISQDTWSKHCWYSYDLRRIQNTP